MRAKLKISLFFSLLAGNLEVGDRFALDCVRRQVLNIGLAPNLFFAETRIGPIFSGLFVGVSMRHVERRRFSPRLRAAGTLLSRHKN